MTPRTFLFAPASDECKVGKALASGADVAVLDLEDGVSLVQKEAARHVVATVLGAGPNRGNGAVGIRINPVGSPPFDADMKLVGAAPPEWLVIPKVESADDVRVVQERLPDPVSDAGTRPWITATMETPKGILASESVCRDGRVRAVVFGAGDLSAALGVRESLTRSELDYPRSHVALAAAAHGVFAIDCPYYQDLSRMDALRADAERGRRLGYRAKATIHPAHLDVVLSVYSPIEQDVTWARAVVRAHEAARAEGTGAAQAAGSLVDEPIVEQARTILADAARAASAERGPAGR